jgi:hypothetical protein
VQVDQTLKTERAHAREKEQNNAEVDERHNTSKRSQNTQKTYLCARRVVLCVYLVDAHLEAIPSVGTLTARRLAGGDAEHLGGQAHGAGVIQALGLGTLDQVLKRKSTTVKENDET